MAGWTGCGKSGAAGFPEPSAFVPLQVAVVNSRCVCALKLCNGRRLQIDSGTDPRWVAAALEDG